MSDYRRFFVPGGTYFFTIVTQHRRHLFATDGNVNRLRDAVRDVQQTLPFTIDAAVVLPDHLHFIWSLPPGDRNYSQRIGMIKVGFTRALRSVDHHEHTPSGSSSRRKHRESDVWQRRFWEHVVRDEDEFEAYFDYVHYNPVKHQHAVCPHQWAASSFHRWVKAGVYEDGWGCRCGGRRPGKFDFSKIEDIVGEPVSDG